VDDFMIRRFLRARDLDIEKASALFLKYLSWRKEFVPNDTISPSEIPNDLAHDKLFMQGQDKLGRPIVVVFGGRHKQTSLEEFKRMRSQNLSFRHLDLIFFLLFPTTYHIICPGSYAHARGTS
jgi:hypothetical protein